MKIIESHSQPSDAPEREPYRVRIEGKDGQAIEIVEQMTGGFLIVSVSYLSDSKLAIHPIDPARVIVRAK